MRHPSAEQCYDLGGAVEISHQYCERTGVAPVMVRSVLVGRMLGFGGAGLLAAGIAVFIGLRVRGRHPAASG
jgi:hypothetical protein